MIVSNFAYILISIEEQLSNRQIAKRVFNTFL